MAEHLGDLLLKVKADTKQYDKGIKGAKKTALGFKTSLLAVSAAAVGVGLAIGKAFSYAEAGAKIDAQRKAFDNLARTYNTSGNKILNSLKDISKGAVDSATLIEAANKAMLTNIDPKSFVKFMEIARAASKATGETIAKSFSDISVGVARQSRMILDNLGIIVQEEKVYRKFATALGITASQLSDTQKKTAFLNATLEAGQRIIDGVGNHSLDAADKIARMKTEIKNSTDNLKLLASEGLGALVTGLGHLEGALTKNEKAANFLALGPGVSRGGKFAHETPGTPAYIAEQKRKEIEAQIKALKNQVELDKGFVDFMQGGGRRPMANLQAKGFAGPKKLGIDASKFDELINGSKKTEDALVDLDKEINQKGVDLGDMANNGEKAFSRLENAVTGWASTFSSSLADTLMGAEVSFKGILDSFTRMMLEMTIQARVVEPLLKGLFGTSNAPRGGITGPPTPQQASGGGNWGGIISGIGSAFGKIMGFADGGIVPGKTGAPMPAIVHGGEKITPAGGGGNVEINIIGAPEGTRTEESETNQGGKRIDIIIDEIVSGNIRHGTRTFNKIKSSFENMTPVRARR